MINTDGIALCNKSNLTLWPVFLCINEIEIEKRFAIENVIVAGSTFLDAIRYHYFANNFYVGLSVGDCKPDFDAFLLPIIKQLKELEIGVNLEISGEMRDNYHFYLINGVFDKPARSSILNIKSSNGFHGCLKCLQPGKSIKTDKGDTKII